MTCFCPKISKTTLVLLIKLLFLLIDFVPRDQTDLHLVHEEFNLKKRLYSSIKNLWIMRLKSFNFQKNDRAAYYPVYFMCVFLLCT